MTNLEIYDAALRLASEIPLSDTNEDYEARAPYLLAMICHRYAALDRVYRLVHGLEEQELLSITHLPLQIQFPLSEPFLAPVSTALAALLVLEENPQLSKSLAELEGEMIHEIREGIPFQKETIVSRYDL